MNTIDFRRSPKRVYLAAALGAALFAAAAVIAVGDFAIARGNFIPPPASAFEPEAPSPAAPRAEGSRSEAPRSEFRASAPDRHFTRRPAAVAVAARGGFVYGKAVCVRLCDGFFFPTVTTASNDATCAAQCPDAPVALYSFPGGSDSISEAVSLTGARYSALPVALRHQTSFDDTCSCHRSFARSRVEELLRDFTLRRGDLVMTSSGFKVFEGAGNGVASAKDFVALAQAPSLSKDARESLLAMERAGTWSRQSGSYSPSAPLAAPNSEAEPMRLKGILTVEDKSSATVSR